MKDDFFLELRLNLLRLKWLEKSLSILNVYRYVNQDITIYSL